MALKSQAWGLLFDRPALRQTLDTLKGYTYLESARRSLCQQYELNEAQLADVLKVHTIAAKGSQQGRPQGKPPRDGLDLLLDTPELRAELDSRRYQPAMEHLALTRLRERYKLTRPELVAVLNAHADMLSRP